MNTGIARKKYSIKYGARNKDLLNKINIHKADYSGEMPAQVNIRSSKEVFV
jgi:hypothetical protein